LDEVREFYWRGIEDGVVVYDEHAYAEDVLARAPKNKFRASLLWLVEGDAITPAQADRLDDIYAHRHDLSHELMSIRRFWTSVEKDIGSFEEFGDVDLDGVTPLSLANGLPHARHGEGADQSRPR
jgi:hypothetical protein